MGQAFGSGGRVSDRYHLQKVTLGQGAFGTVRRAIDRRSNEIVAVKQLDKDLLRSRGVSRADIEREIKVMQAVKHRNIGQLLDSFEDTEAIYLAIEYCDGGDFGDKIKEGIALEKDAAGWMGQIIAPIAALHARGVVHRDIKPDNYMVSSGALKLSDFGLATFCPASKLLTEKLGTPAFMSPEQHMLPRKSRGYTNLCDLWAAGIMLYIMMYGGHPFLDGFDRLDERRLIQGTLDFGVAPSLFGAGAAYGEAARRLCRRLVEPDPSRRLSADESLLDEWIAGGASSAVRAEDVREARARLKAAGPSRGTVPVLLSTQKFESSDARASSPPSGDPTSLVATAATQGGGGASKGAAGGASYLFGCLRQGQAFEAFGAAFDIGLCGSGAGAHASAAAHAGRLMAGTRCRWRASAQADWVDCCVRAFNARDVTYDLDVRSALARRRCSGAEGTPANGGAPEAADAEGQRRAVAPETLAPAPDADEDEAWPPGTRVSYHSTTAKSWIPATITSFNPGDKSSDCTYNLDVRQCASVDRLRARGV